MTKETILEALERHRYLNLETLRKSGVAVRTPVWFVRRGDRLYVRTGANSGKVKRLRNNPQVRVAPCTRMGDLLGEWQPARATLVDDPAEALEVERLVNRKYGLLKRIFDLLNRWARNEWATIAIELVEDRPLP